MKAIETKWSENTNSTYKARAIKISQTQDKHDSKCVVKIRLE